MIIHDPSKRLTLEKRNATLDLHVSNHDPDLFCIGVFANVGKREGANVYLARQEAIDYFRKGLELLQNEQATET